MPPVSRRRQVPVEDDEEDEVVMPTQRTQRRVQLETPDAESEGYGEEGRGRSGLDQLHKSFVRYALACEYSRTPIKRQDVNQKVLGSNSRLFKQVFDAANSELLDVFGMEMIELPNKDKVTVRQKRSAAASESQNKTSSQWVLRNALPDKFRTPNIIEPAQIPTAELESSYVGFYTMVIALIMLSGGQISHAKLDKYLQRMNANETTLMGAGDKVMARMIKEGYIVRIKDTSSGEEMVDYIVGPRGKVEVGSEGVANMVRSVYGDGAMPDLEQRLSRSLEVTITSNAQSNEANGAATEGGNGAKRKPGRPRKRRADEEEDDDDAE